MTLHESKKILWIPKLTSSGKLNSPFKRVSEYREQQQNPKYLLQFLHLVNIITLIVKVHKSTRKNNRLKMMQSKLGYKGIMNFVPVLICSIT